MISQAELFEELPDVVPPTPDVYAVLAVYEGPGPHHGVWKLFGPFATPAAAHAKADGLSRWYRRRRIFRLT